MKSPRAPDRVSNLMTVGGIAGTVAGFANPLVIMIAALFVVTLAAVAGARRVTRPADFA